MVRVAAQGLEDAAGVGDRVSRHEGEQVGVVDHDVGVGVAVVHARVLVVVEPVVRQGIAQPVVVEPGQPLGVGVEVLEVGLGPEGPRGVVLLILHVGQGFLVHPRLVQPLVVLFEEVAVGDVGELELEPQVLELVLVVIGQEPLHVAHVEPAPDLLERGHVRALIASLACAGRPVGDDGRTRAQHVVAEVLQAPDVEVAEVVVGDVLAGVRTV